MATPAEIHAHGSVLPLGYYEDFLRFLSEHRDLIRVITYADMKWAEDQQFRWSYPGECRAWRRDVSARRRGERRIEVLIQHDVDSNPERTLDMLELEARYGIRSNVMIFDRLVDRGELASSGQVRELPYRLDVPRLRELEKMGFLIGYHCNAYERAQFRIEQGRKFFADDISSLRENFDIRFYSNHGGVRDAHGLSNRDQSWPGIECGVRLVHNPHGPVFSRTYTDGAFMRRSPESLDLRNHVQHWVPGLRYRVLIHPQYFHERPEFLQRMASGDWYRDAFKRHCATRLPPSGNTPTELPWPDLRSRTASDRVRLALMEHLRVWIKRRRLSLGAILRWP